MRQTIFLILISIIITAGCRKPYDPEVTAASNSYLVVEGFINSGLDSTVIKLNRTVKLSGKTNVNPELGATVTVESDGNESTALFERPNGVYLFPGLNLPATHKYRLSIKTSGGREYVSDFVPVLAAPPIDSVFYKIGSDGVSLGLNTHDAKNATRYYRWEYDETWMFSSAYQSFYKSNGDTVLRRDQLSDQIYICWRTTLSSTIILGSSAKLSQDVITGAPIAFLSKDSQKIKIRYSPIIRQYALTKDAYTFWANLKKNTEQLGSIFDAQPTQINGNIHSVSDPDEPVIGYISAGTYSSKRIFIDRQDLPVLSQEVFPGCELNPYLFKYTDPITGLIVNQVDEYMNFNRSSGANIIPVAAIQPPGAPSIIGFTGSSASCVDCRVNGTTKQPSFWVPYK